MFNITYIILLRTNFAKKEETKTIFEKKSAFITLLGH